MMCSIPGLPTPGSDVPVLITRVNLNPKCGLVELWVNMDDGRKHIYERMKEEIQIPKRKFFGSEGNPGDLCLAYISDTWHRARIVSNQSETCNVFLIDQGLPHIATSEDLAWGQSDSFLLPPEIESCILANVHFLENNWPESATKFLNSLPGKKLKGLVQHVLMPDRTILLDIPMVSKHLCKLGVAKKIPVSKFKCLVHKCLHLPQGDDTEAYHITQNLKVSCQLEKHDQYFYPELLTDMFETVNVTEVIDPQNIFCQVHIFSKLVKLLSEQIHKHYEETSDFGEEQPQTSGDPCAAKGERGRWHRSLLKQNIVSGNAAVEVLHVDVGKTEFIPVGDIRPLNGKFLRLPVVTYLCSLDGVNDNGTGWSTNQTEYLKSLILNETVVVRFNQHAISQDIYYVTVYTAKGVCINDCFLETVKLHSPCETVNDLNAQNEPIPSSFLSSPGDEWCVDLQNKDNSNVDTLAKTLPNTKKLIVNGGTDGHLSTCCSSEVHDAHQDVLTVGSSVNVKVSCIESLQRFWCQTTDNSESLGLLMEDLQKHYASAHPQPLVESICVARHPENGMWYRARIIASHHSPEVDVRFIDYGQTQKVPLRDVRPIDPAFLQLNAQAVQCCLLNLKNPTNPTAATWTDAALTEFEEFVSSGASLNNGLKCIAKARTSDEEGMPVYVVDLKTPSESASRRLAQKCGQAESPVLPLVSSDAYSYSTYNIEVGGKEKVLVTSSKNVHHFYCQLERNSHLLEKVKENVKQLICQPQCTNRPLGLNSVCLARYTDNQWYRGQVVGMSPKLKVHFVDYGDTLIVNKSDIRTLPSDESITMSIPAQALPLGLFNVPAEVPQEVNQWFADNAINQNLTILVVAKEARGKLIVELFPSLNANGKVRQRIAKMKPQKTYNKSQVQQTDRQQTKSSKHASVSDVDCSTQKLINMSPIRGITENGQVNSKSTILVSIPELEPENTLDEVRKPTMAITLKDKEMVPETLLQSGQIDSEMTQLSVPSCPEEIENTHLYKKPNISQNKTEEVYASCIVGPHFFWCQRANTENLNIVSRQVQEEGQRQQNTIFPKALGPGCPCLALFSSDNQWYRAQVLQRAGNTINVLFVDYGNESEVDIKDVRTMPQSLLEQAPQAFLCSLNEFDESQGSWDDAVYDDFYNLLIDKPLRVTVLNMKDQSKEIAVPQFAVKMECEDVAVNSMMQKYWKPFSKEHGNSEIVQTATFLQDGQTESNMTHLKENGNTCMYKKPDFAQNKMEEVYASSIGDPNFFWCQYANTENLRKVSRLAQEAGRAEQDVMFPETLGPGSPCLALFSSDNQWYRAQVIQRNDNKFDVVFIDYGNESDVGIRNVRPVPQSLLEQAPQAFLCSLNGFELSKGSWDDKVYDYFYNLLINKLLKVSMCKMEDHSDIALPQYAVEVKCEGVIVNAEMQVYWKPDAKEHVMMEIPQTETFLQDGQAESNTTHFKENGNTSSYKKPNISKNKMEEVYISSIGDPHFFWCQYGNTEDQAQMSRLAQEAGQGEQDLMFPETLGPGSPCLALFSSDNQWYRAQIIRRNDDKLDVVFIDYGNESDVDIKNVRPVPQCLLEQAPQAFLCSLNGFEESGGSWDDKVYDDFYNLVVDKPLKVSVFNMKDHAEFAVPQYAVEIECEGVIVNTLMEKYWKGFATENQDSADKHETRTMEESVGI